MEDNYSNIKKNQKQLKEIINNSIKKKLKQLS